MLFTRCARQAKLISDGMSDERTLEIQRAALELQQFEGYVRKRTTSSHTTVPSVDRPTFFHGAGDGHQGHREARGRGSEHRASVQVAESLRKGGQQPRRPGRAGPALPEKELTKLVLRQADTLSLPAAGPGLHFVSQDLHEAWAIVTDLEVGGSNQPQRDLANHADALHDRGPPGASGIPCGERQRSPSPRATGTSRGRQVPLPQVEPQHEIPREDGPRSALPR